MRRKMRNAGSGAFDQRVTVRRVTRTPDGYGGATEAWADIGTVWAECLQISGDESAVGDAKRAVSRYRFTSRNAGVWAGLTASDRLSWGGMVFDIRHAPDVARALDRVIEAETGAVQ
jgi:head-tail adaptor